MKSNETNNMSYEEINESGARSRIRHQNISGYKEERPILDDDEHPQIQDSAEKDKIINQNIRLKEQIFQLSNQLEEILEKDRNRKRKLGPINHNDDD